MVMIGKKVLDSDPIPLVNVKPLLEEERKPMNLVMSRIWPWIMSPNSQKYQWRMQINW